MYDKNNYWNEFEYNKLKLLCHQHKVNNILEVYEGLRYYDNLPPISVEMHLTNRCNLRCPWCTDRNLQGNSNSLQKNKVFELLRYFGKTGTGVTLEGGGEPTIYTAFKEIVEYAHVNDVNLGLITNGTVDISDVINCFRWVRVSLDSSTREEYVVEKGKDMFERVINNLRTFSEKRDNRNCFLGVGYVITNRNIDNILKIVDILNEINVDYIYFRPVEENEDLLPTRDELYDLRKKLIAKTENMRIKFLLTINDRLEYDNCLLPCVAHSITSIIHANGDVYCCEKRRHDDQCFGNVYTSSFEDIWKSEKRRKITSKLLDPENQKGCSACRITPFNKIINQLEKMNTCSFI